MSFRWVYSEPERERSVSEMAETLSIPTEIARLLVIRGIDNFSDAKSFFRPESESLHDPFLMKDMDLAAATGSHPPSATMKKW
jgi:single-stranded-DNA-specific exonuclease